MIKKLAKNKLLILIVFLAAFLRFYKLDQVPPSLNWDEVSHGYNAYSILKTGKDEWGNLLPSIFRAYGDYKLPVYIYVTAISVLLFGFTPFAVRLPSAVAGIVTVILTFFLVEELVKERGLSEKKHQSSNTKHKTIAALAAILVAVEPWSLFLSRAAFEANLALTFIISGVYFFLKGIHDTKYLILASFLYGLSVWTYNSARVFVPILIIFLVWLYKVNIKKNVKSQKKFTIKALVVLLVFLIPMFLQLANSSGQARYGKVAIIDQGAIAEINNARNSSEMSSFLTRAMHNKVTYFVPRFLFNWSKHFSGEFLYFYGGDNYQFSVPGRGILYLLNLPFLITGIYILLKKTKKGHRSAALILFWFFTGPVASSLTREAPHVLRSVTTLPSPMIITAIGVFTIINFLNNKAIKVDKKYSVIVYIMLLTFSLLGYSKDYFSNYAKNYSQSWQYGNKQMAVYIKSRYGDYDKIIITKKYGEPHEFILFYWPWDPKAYQNGTNLIRYEQSDWYWIDGFDKFYFVNDWQVVGSSESDDSFILESGGIVQCSPEMYDCLLVTTQGNVPQGWKMLETIKFSDGSVAYEIYENKNIY